MSRGARRILLINGHPDPRPERLCSALTAAYAAGAAEAGHQVRQVNVGELDFPLIRSAEEFRSDPPPAIVQIQLALSETDHIVIVHPLWLGGMPARLKGFMEQVFRYGVALSAPGEKMHGLLKGKSARVVVTMGMPSPIFRLVFGAAGLKSLERGLLWVSGVRPISHLVLGGVEGQSLKARKGWIARMRRLGRLGR